MELLVFGEGGRAVLFFPTRMARFYDYEDWKMIESIKDRIDKRELQIFCVDSIDAESFYNQDIAPANRIIRHLQYEQYILKEVLPFMKLKNKGKDFEVAGCSMGAYHAINLAFKHPRLFNKVVAMSGRFDLTDALQDFKDLFNGYRDENIYYNMPLQYVANLEDKHILNALKKIEIILVIGETDPFFSSNQRFHMLLRSKNVPNQLYVWRDYAHRPRYWRQMLKLYL